MNNDNCQRAESTHSLDSCAENRASWHSLADRAFDLNRLPRAASDLMNTRMHSMLSRIHIFQHCRHVGLLRTCYERAAMTLFIAPYVNRKMEICLRSYFSILKYAGSTQSVVLFVFLFLNSVTRSIGANNSTYSHWISNIRFVQLAALTAICVNPRVSEHRKSSSNMNHTRNEPKKPQATTRLSMIYWRDARRARIASSNALEICERWLLKSRRPICMMLFTAAIECLVCAHFLVFQAANRPHTVQPVQKWQYKLTLTWNGKADNAHILRRIHHNIIKCVLFNIQYRMPSFVFIVIVRWL